jgi:methylase of polypeptide subunit release factors
VEVRVEGKIGLGSLTRNQALAKLSERLERAGYEESRVDRLVRDDRGLGFEDGLAALRLRPEADEPLCVLVRLFLAREGLPIATAAAALGQVDLRELAGTGLVAVRDGVVRARFALEPFEGLVVASDHAAGRLRADHVVQIGPATRTLATLTVRRPVEAALDLGTGSGVQAFLAARHSEQVVGIDLNPHALRLAHLNAALNGVDNVDWRQGNLFEPVRDERFALVAANPPFVVSPVQELTYRDGGLGGDTLSCEAVAGAARHLHEGGFASILCSWVTEPGDERAGTPRRWLEGSGCDVWVLELSTDDPVTYAVRWNGLPGRRPAAVATAAEPWLADYRARGIEAISTGAIVIRKRSGKNWAHFDELATALRGDAGAHLERIFAAQDLLHALGDERKLLTIALVPALGTLLVERRLPGGELERARLTVEQGIPLPGRVPVSVAPVLAELDGRRPLADIVETAARVGGVSPEGLSAECLPALRELVARGLLVPGHG